MNPSLESLIRKETIGRVVLVLASLLYAAMLCAQEASSVVPNLVNYSGRLTDSMGQPLTGIQGVTFSLYKDQQGGAPLWIETQNVQLDKSGHYTVMLGSATQGGLPPGLFASGEARWLGAQAQGQAEQPRVMLLAVPYALKAGDAQTVGGLPASAFMLAAPAGGSTASNSGSDGFSGTGAGPNVGGRGTAGYLAGWVDNNGDLGNSAFFQSGSGSSAKIGLNLKNPLTTLDVNGSGLMRGFLEMATTGFANSSKGFNSNQFNIESSAYNSSTKKYTLQHFLWQAEPTGNNTNNPSATLNLLFNTDPNKPAETGLSISSKGVFTFAAGQTFPGTGNGTITGVTAGTDLTGGGTSGNVTLNLNTTATDARYAQLAVSNSFTGNETVSGNLTSGGIVQGAQGLYMNSTGAGPLLAVQNDTSRTDDGMEGVVYSPQNGSAGVVGSALAKTGTVFGVEGEAQSGLGSGVYGINGAPSLMSANGSKAGVWGDAGTIGQVGVVGTADSVNAIVGLNNSKSGYGAVVGRNFGASSLAPGAVGLSDSAVGMGVIGAGFTFSNNFNNSAGFNPVGVVGDSAVPGGTGVWGSTDDGTSVFGSTNSGMGVFGLSQSAMGVYGRTYSTDGSGNTAAVWGDSLGTQGYASGVQGLSISGPGLSGTGDPGVLGSSQVGDGVYGESYIAGAASGEFRTGRQDNFAFVSGGAGGSCTIDYNGSFNCHGNLSSVIPLSDSRFVRVYATQSAENWFEDYGTGQLTNGVASIELDATFRNTVNADEEYHVFLTPDGDCNGLYVAQKTSAGFTVRELGHGKAHISFDYRIVAHRKGYENVRLEDVTQQQAMLAENTKRSEQMYHRMIARPATPKQKQQINSPAVSRRTHNISGLVQPFPRSFLR